MCADEGNGDIVSISTLFLYRFCLLALRAFCTLLLVVWVKTDRQTDRRTCSGMVYVYVDRYGWTPKIWAE